MAGLDWLTARPIAHRGLHDAANGVIENTGSAFSAAIAGGYGIECDLQLSADAEAMVFHDDTLDRLTEGHGAVASRDAATLKTIAFKNTSDRMLRLEELCDLVGGRVPLLLELKSHFDGDVRLASRVAEVLQGYAGPVAGMSFDPALIRALQREAPGLPRGLVAQSRRDEAVPVGRARYVRNAFRARPHFLAWSVRDLTRFWPLLGRWGFGLPLLTWTVRTDKDRLRAQRWADQMIFEGFRP